tara:strand:- start:29 stop:1753 length:1725 start_codon:yes stop_codon:yes gene_type:complete
MSENLESRHFINGTEIRPKDADKIGIKLDWTADAQEAELSVDSLILENKAKKLVLDHIDTLGVFEGIPYTYQINNLTIDYYLKLIDDPKISGVGDSAIEVNIHRRRSVNKFWEDANGLSFESCNLTHPFVTQDIPYLIVKDNQVEMLIMLGISAYTLTKALIEGIRDLIVAITDFIKIISVGTVVNVGQIISAALLLIARIIYVAALIIALIDITKQIIELIFPPIRYFKGASVQELCQKACAKLGYTFESSIIDNMTELTILPVPLIKGETSIIEKLFTLDTGYHTKGYPTARDSAVSTFGRLLNVLKGMFNAKVRVLNGVVMLERRDFWELNAGVQIKRTLNLQGIRENQWGYNSGDWWKRYYMHYLWDSTDFHTMDRLGDLDTEYSTEPVSVVNADLVSIRGLVDIAIPFSFATRKDYLTWVEKEALKFAKLADSVISFFGGNSALQSKVKGRVGVTMIGQQYFSNTKIMFQTGGRQPEDYRDKIGADTLYQTYHTINQVKENFKRHYSEVIPFSTSDFEMLLDNNYVTDENGVLLEILTLEWTNEGKEAEILYAIDSNEGDNTKTIRIDG